MITSDVVVGGRAKGGMTDTRTKRRGERRVDFNSCINVILNLVSVSCRSPIVLYIN